MRHIAEFGQFNEILIVAEDIISIQGVPDYDRAGQVVMEVRSDDPSMTARPRFVASEVGLRPGNSISVPHPPYVVERRRRAALGRE